MGSLIEARRKILLSAPHLTVRTDQNKIMTFTTDVVAPLKKCIVRFGPIQVDNGSPPSPENEIPLTGWTGLNLYRIVEDSLGEESQQTIATVDWTNVAGTIYGGEIDFINGILDACIDCVTINGTQTVQARETASNYNIFRIPKSALPITSSNSYMHIEKASYFDNNGNFSQPWQFFMEATSGSFRFTMPKSYTTTTSVQNYFMAHPLTLAYRIEEKRIYTVNPTTVYTLRGINKISSNSNSDIIKMSYWTH